MDTSQFGQDTGGDDIYFDEAEDSEDEGAAGNDIASGNLNRGGNNNMASQKDLYDDMTDSEDSDTEEGE